eukprot:m.22962 g.22962  ORF g.22962 m.22962 type:complete len:1116 (+) comp28428_c0_seq4:209-3556(+)
MNLESSLKNSGLCKVVILHSKEDKGDVQKALSFNVSSKYKIQQRTFEELSANQVVEVGDVCLALISSHVLESHLAIMTLHKFSEKLLPSNRMLPVLANTNGDVFSKLGKQLPALAFHSPFLLKDRNDWKKLWKAAEDRLPSAPSPSFIQIELIDTGVEHIWRSEGETTTVTVEPDLVGFSLKGLHDATRKVAAFYIDKVLSQQQSLERGARVEEIRVGGSPVDIFHYKNCIKKAKVEKKDIVFRIRPAFPGFNDQLHNFQEKVGKLQDLSGLFDDKKLKGQKSSHKVSRKEIVITCCAEDEAASGNLRDMLSAEASVKIIVISADSVPPIGVLHVHCWFPVISDAMLESATAIEVFKTFASKLKQMEQWPNKVEVVCRRSSILSEPSTLEKLGLSQEEVESVTLSRPVRFLPNSFSIVNLTAEKFNEKSAFSLPNNQPIPLQISRFNSEDGERKDNEDSKHKENSSKQDKFEKLFSALKDNGKVQDLLEVASFPDGISYEQYKKFHNFSLDQADEFWGQLAETFDFRSENGAPGDVRSKVMSKEFFDDDDGRAVHFLKGRKTNLCVNMIDRHIADLKINEGRSTKMEDRSDQVALRCGNAKLSDPEEFTYRQLYHATCYFAKQLQFNGLSKGSRALICISESPTMIITVLACLRIGVVVGLLEENTNKSVYEKSGIEYLITENESKKQLLIQNYGVASFEAENSQGTPIDIDWRSKKEEHDPVWVDSSDIAFFATTTGTTSRPKVVEHQTGGYMVFAATTFKYVLDFNLKSSKETQSHVCWSTASMSWTYGWTIGFCAPLLNGGTIVRVDGANTAHLKLKLWSFLEKYQVSHFCSIPRIMENFARVTDENLKKIQPYLKVISSSGARLTDSEKISKHLKDKGIRVFDVWWQTETGSFMIGSSTRISGISNAKTLLPFYGVSARVEQMKSEDASLVQNILVIDKPWPGCFCSYNDKETYRKVFIDMSKGCKVYSTGDCAESHVFNDKHELFVIPGRKENILNFRAREIMTPQRRYSVQAEDVEEAAHGSEINQALAFVSKRTDPPKLTLQIVPKQENLSNESKEELKRDVKRRVRERLTNAVEEKDVKMDIVCVPEILTKRDKALRRANSLIPAVA